MRKHVLLYGGLGGVLIAVLKLIEYRWLVVEHSVEMGDAHNRARGWNRPPSTALELPCKRAC